MISLSLEKYNERKAIKKRARDIVYFLSETTGERTLRRYDSLNRVRTYIRDDFTCHGGITREEIYTVNGYEVANIITEIPGFENPGKIILIGAHYDTIEGTPGADDNASAVAALLELFRLLSPFRFRRTLRFVAFTLEEPPFFGSELMGSMHNASRCRHMKENVELMICLEMIGYGGKKIKQDFPFSDMKNKFPPDGNYLTVVSLPSHSHYVYLWKKIYNGHSHKSIFDIVGPASIPGIDLSDHSSFIKNGYPAIMLTDTAYYRNKNYHTENDRFETINLNFLTENILYSYQTIRDLANLERLKDEK